MTQHRDFRVQLFEQLPPSQRHVVVHVASGHARAPEPVGQRLPIAEPRVACRRVLRFLLQQRAERLLLVRLALLPISGTTAEALPTSKHGHVAAHAPLQLVSHLVRDKQSINRSLRVRPGVQPRVAPQRVVFQELLEVVEGVLTGLRRNVEICSILSGRRSHLWLSRLRSHLCLSGLISLFVM